jgi:hypothetical protein
LTVVHVIARAVEAPRAGTYNLGTNKQYEH